MEGVIYFLSRGLDPTSERQSRSGLDSLDPTSKLQNQSGLDSLDPTSKLQSPSEFDSLDPTSKLQNRSGLDPLDTTFKQQFTPIVQSDTNSASFKARRCFHIFGPIMTSFTQSFMHLFLHSFIHSFILHSFMHHLSFTQFGCPPLLRTSGLRISHEMWKVIPSPWILKDVSMCFGPPLVRTHSDTLWTTGIIIIRTLTPDRR